MELKLKTPPARTLVKYLSIPVLLYVLIAVAPIFIAFYNSFFSDSKKVFIGLANYLQAVKDPAFSKSLINNIVITALALVGQVGGGFVVALFLHVKFIRYKGFHQTVIFFPVVMSTVVIGLIWMMIYLTDVGLLDTLLRIVGREDWIHLWLDDPKYVVGAVSVPVMWQFIGMYMVIFMSGLANIPPDILESAELDGITGIKKMLFIQLPMIYPTFKVCVMVCIAGTMKIFDHIYVMTGGGPGNSSSVLALYAYRISFVRMRMNYGSALSIWILVVGLVFVMGGRTLLGGKRYE